MCSIFGVVGDYSPAKVKEAFDKIEHRGVDSSALVMGSHLAVGSHRLAITNIKDAIPQPYLDRLGRYILFNGEIYNYKELALRLNCIADEIVVISEAYSRWGDSFTLHLDGFFAIAIVYQDGVKLWRDRFGKKPLYYTKTDNTIVFASEIDAIESITGGYIDRKLFSQVLFFQTTIPPTTIYRGINQLSCGEMVKIDFSTIDSKFWYRYSFAKHKHTNIKTTIFNLFSQSVIKRIPSDTKWASLLSGGLDSSAVATIASRYIDKIDTFSVGYSGYEQYDERKWAALVARDIGSNHHSLQMDRDDFLESMEEWLEHIDEPLLDPASIPLWYMMKQISKSGYKVVLTGDGSDELFMGYRLYKEFLDIEDAGKLRYKNWLKNYFRANFSMNKEWERYKRVFSDTLLFRSTAELYTDLQLNRLLRLNVADDTSMQSIMPIYNRFVSFGGSEYLDWYSFCDIHTQLSELYLKKLDRVTMAHGIEARSPFLDTKLVDYLFSLESSVRLGSNTKELLKDTLKGVVHNDIIHRKKKGFSYPFIEWLEEAGELQKILDIQQRVGIFKDEALASLLERGKKRKRFKHHIFALYILSRWVEKRLK